MSKNPTPQDVIAKIKMVFPDRPTSDVLSVLNRYGKESHEREILRVQLAILKLCDEKPDVGLDYYVNEAKQDYRDVLYWAEYPKTSETPPDDGAGTAKAGVLDEAQYKAWLAKK